MTGHDYFVEHALPKMRAGLVVVSHR